MSDERRRRLESVIYSLIGLERFSSEQAKQRCTESKPAFVTRTIAGFAPSLQLRKPLMSEPLVGAFVV